MALPQEKFREIIFQILYSQDIADCEPDHLSALLMKELSTTKKNLKLAWERVEQVRVHQEEIDEKIRAISQEWRFERIQLVERNILRLGVFELLYDEEIPPKVAIAEALRLTKKFSSPEASSYVNAVLDAIYKKSIGESAEEEKIANTFESLLKSEEVPE